MSSSYLKRSVFNCLKDVDYLVLDFLEYVEYVEFYRLIYLLLGGFPNSIVFYGNNDFALFF